MNCRVVVATYSLDNELSCGPKVLTERIVEALEEVCCFTDTLGTVDFKKIISI